MDAAHTQFKKTAFFFALSLIVLAPGLQAATTPAFTNPGTFTLPAGTGGGSVSISSNIDSTTGIHFQATLGSFQCPGPQNFQWVSFNGLSAGLTPTSISLYPSNLGSTQGTYSATVTITATDGSGAPPITFQVQYVSGSSGGGGTSGTIIATPPAVTLSAAAGSQNTVSSTVGLSTYSTSPVNFSLSYQQQNYSQNQWLLVTASSVSVSSTAGASMTVYASPFNLPTAQYTGLITLTPTNGGAVTTVQVTFNVGTGTGGSLTFGSYGSWNYTTNGTYPSAQTVTISNSSATTYGASWSTSNSLGWLLVNGSTVPVYSQSVSSGITLSPNTGVLFSLATGTYTATISVTDGNGQTGSFTLSLTVNGGSTSSLTISPSSGLTFTGAVGSGITSPQDLYITSGVAGTVTLTCTSSGWLQCGGNPTSISANSQTAFVVTANAFGLTNGTYYGQLSISVAGSSTLSGSVNMTFIVGSGGGGGGGTTGFVVAPTSLIFTYQTGTSRQSVARQTLGITGPSGSSWTGTSGVTTPSGGTWLNISTVLSNFQQDGTSSTLVTIDPNGLGAGTYTGTVTITTGGVSQSVNVTLNVVANPILLPSPGSALFNYHTGDPALQPQSIGLTASDGSGVTATAASTTTWLTVTQTAGATSFSVVANPAGMAAGIYTGAVTVTQGNLANSPLTIPVVLIINGGTSTGGGGLLTLSPTALTYSAILYGSSPGAQTLYVSAATSTNFSVSASTTEGTGWLTVSQSGGVASTSAISLLVFVNSTGLTLGTHTGTITFTANGGSQTVQVTLNITTTGGTGGVTANPTSLSFSGQAGGANPGTQTLTISSSSGSAPVSVTVAATTSSGGSWLTVTPTSGNTQLAITVTASLTGLAAGTYNGNIAVTPASGAALSIPVTLTVAAPSVSASPTSLTFNYRAGDAAPAAQTISVSGGTGLTYTATAAAANNGTWLSVSTGTGMTPDTVTVSISPTGLTASPTPYTGTITVAGSGTATGSTTITVTLTVTAPLPTVSKVTNAGSFLTATAVSPGEIITLFSSDAQHPIGPSTPAGLTLDSTGKVATTIGGVQVLASGFACPMIYASSTQVSAVVPYELAGYVFTGADLEVRFLGQTSNAVHVNVTTTSPGLFTLNSSGTGPGAILNSNGSVNSPSNPSAKGDIVVVYLTGEGQTTPAGVTGKVTTVSATPPLTPAPLLPISILIGPTGAQQAANYIFAGEAPGFISGAMQLNVRLPTTINSGDQPIVVAIGPNSSQSGVTVSVR